ncbi:MAG: chemotaxis protein CheW [Bacillus sp. (in: firmicutes)]
MAQETASINMKVIVFQLQQKEYAIRVDHVRGIEKMKHITRVPNTEPYVKGVINLRGVVFPIINLRNRFGFPEETDTDKTRIIIVSVAEKEVGFIVDAAQDVMDIPEDQIESQPGLLENDELEFFTGVIKYQGRLLILLDLEKILVPNMEKGRQSGEEK